MRVLLLGSRGYLGQEFLKLYSDAACPRIDMADASQVSQVLEEVRPDIVINAAGRTGQPNVDWCEDHKMETLRSNVTGPLVLLEECAKRGIYWVHLSSGCIYSGDKGGKGYNEEDPPNFSGSFYARTKGWIDQILRDFPSTAQSPGVLVLRLRMPFDDSSHERNLLRKLQRYTKILDVPNSISCLPDFLAAAKTLIAHRRTGVFNIVNSGSISPYEIMGLYREIVDPTRQFERITERELPTVVRAGRSNCLLSIEKLEQEGISMPPVRAAVISALQRMGKQG